MAKLTIEEQIADQEFERVLDVMHRKAHEKSADQKPACAACGSTEYEGELKPCAYCDGTKCSMCDAGNDCACLACEEHDMGN